MEASFGTGTQTQSAQRMYNARATKYEGSWHPAYSRRFISLVPLKTGDRVLDLCCGTGLEAFLAADIVGPGGEVVGVDVSSGMLERQRERRRREPELGGRIKDLHHDVTDLEGVAGVAEGSFDAVLCFCAFVLLDDPAGVVAHWKEYLKPGGIMAIDVPHQRSLRPGLVLDRLPKKMGKKYPSNRAWNYSIDSCRAILEWQGMEW